MQEPGGRELGPWADGRGQSPEGGSVGGTGHGELGGREGQGGQNRDRWCREKIMRHRTLGAGQRKGGLERTGQGVMVEKRALWEANNEGPGSERSEAPSPA